MKSFLLLLPLLFLLPTQVEALSCADDKENVWYAAYENGEYIDGFEVRHQFTGNWCDTKPVVGVHTKQEEVFNRLLSGAGNLSSTGVYSVNTKCVFGDEGETCFPSGSLETVSDNPDEIYQEKLSWKDMSQNAARVSGTQKWFSFGFVISSLFVVIAWPWLLIIWRPRLRTRLVTLLIIAIPVQIAFIFMTPMFEWSYEVVRAASRHSANVLTTIIMLEIFLLLYTLFNRNKGKILIEK